MPSCNGPCEQRFIFVRRCVAGFGSIETLEFGARAQLFKGGSTMTRHLVLAISLISIGLLLSSPGEAQQWRCEDQAANCLGRCADRAGGAGDWGGRQSKCLRCDWRLIKCVRNATIRLSRY